MVVVAVQVSSQQSLVAEVEVLRECLTDAHARAGKDKEALQVAMGCLKGT